MRPLEDPTQAEPDIYRGRFERCFDAHYVRIFAFAARRVAGRESAEDAVADTFAVAWRRRDRIPDGDEALPWLYAIAANVIANQYRSSSRRQSLGETLAREASFTAPPADPAEALGGRDELAAALGRLEESEREALRLVAWEGLSTRDGARVVGCSPGAFRVRLHRARRKLAKELKHTGQRTREGRRPTRPAEEGS
jgi:RNA polymerase sigma factor (sigma-70 family)